MPSNLLITAATVVTTAAGSAILAEAPEIVPQAPKLLGDWALTMACLAGTGMGALVAVASQKGGAACFKRGDVVSWVLTFLVGLTISPMVCTQGLPRVGIGVNVETVLGASSIAGAIWWFALVQIAKRSSILGNILFKAASETLQVDHDKDDL